MQPCDSVCNKKWCRNEIYEKNQNKNIGFIQPPFIIPTTNEYGKCGSTSRILLGVPGVGVQMYGAPYRTKVGQDFKVGSRICDH